MCVGGGGGWRWGEKEGDYIPVLIQFFTRPYKPYGFCGHKAPWRKNTASFRAHVKHHQRRRVGIRVQELCEQGGGPGLIFPIPFCHRPSLISHVLSVDVKHHWWKRKKKRKEKKPRHHTNTTRRLEPVTPEPGSTPGQEATSGTSFYDRYLTAQRKIIKATWRQSRTRSPKQTDPSA